LLKITGPGRHAIGGNGSLAQSFPTVAFPQEMRSTPSFSYSSLSHFATESIAGGGTAGVTGLSLNTTTNLSGTIMVLSGGSGAATGAQLLGNLGGSSSWTTWSAEL